MLRAHHASAGLRAWRPLSHHVLRRSDGRRSLRRPHILRHLDVLHHGVLAVKWLVFVVHFLEKLLVCPLHHHLLLHVLVWRLMGVVALIGEASSRGCTTPWLLSFGCIASESSWISLIEPTHLVLPAQLEIY